jgi:hypothetical protein
LPPRSRLLRMSSSPLRFTRHCFAEPCGWRSQLYSHDRSPGFLPGSASRQPLTSRRMELPGIALGVPIRRAGARPPGTWIRLRLFPNEGRPGRRTEFVRRVPLVSKEMVASRALGAAQVLGLSQKGSSADGSTNQDPVRVPGRPPSGGSGAALPVWKPLRGDLPSKHAHLTVPYRRAGVTPSGTLGAGRSWSAILVWCLSRHLRRCT